MVFGVGLSIDYTLQFSVKMMSQTILSWAAGSAAFLFNIATTVFIVIFAVILTTHHQSTAVVAYMSAVFQILSLVLLLYLLYRQTRQEQRFGMLDAGYPKHSPIDLTLAFAILLLLLAAGTTFAALIWTRFGLSNLPIHILGQNIWTLLLPTFILCGLSVASQLLFYAIIILGRRQKSVEHLSDRQSSDQDSHEMSEASRPGTARTAESNPFRSAPDATPPASPRTSETLNSLRSSLTIAIRPSTSKTKLITRPQSSQRESVSISRPSTSRQSQDSGFDTWDTTEVTPQIRETVLRSSPTTSRGPGLATIPGSRSPSPAKALEGPFFLPTRPLESPPSSPPQSPMPPSSSRIGSRPRMRPRSASSEDHIHPLFRSSSPTPPPTAMPGTIVTAAPFAGLLINERHLSRMRSGSLPSSPLARSESFTTANEMFRSPSPPSREITPPIPDFILSAGPRSSIADYGRRKHPEQREDNDTGIESPTAPSR